MSSYFISVYQMNENHTHLKIENSDFYSVFPYIYTTNEIKFERSFDFIPDSLTNRLSEDTKKREKRKK